MAGIPSRGGPPDMISERSTVRFSKSVFGNSQAGNSPCARAGAARDARAVSRAAATRATAAAGRAAGGRYRRRGSAGASVVGLVAFILVLPLFLT